MDDTEGKTSSPQREDQNVSTKLSIRADKAKKNPNFVFTSLAHHLNLEWLQTAYKQTRKSGAPGIDGQTARDYEQNLDENLRSLVDRARSGRYKAPPVKRTFIPKAGTTKLRPIGIPTFEDKVLQRALTMLLNAIYEQDFLEFSYGFRPRRSAHDAIQALWNELMKPGLKWVLEVDIQGYFDTIDHQHLREFLDRRVRDGVVRRLIGKWLRAGVMEDGALKRLDEGTPQGGVISPMLANIFLHEVLDTWYVESVRPRLRGKSFLIRYADDFIMGFEHEQDALRVREVLPKRLGKFGLTVSEEKTRLVAFERPVAQKDSEKGPGNKSDQFDFLGFTHYWTRSRKGSWIVGRKTAKKKLRGALQKMYQWCKTNRHMKLQRQYEQIKRKLLGHYAYYGITGNYRALCQFMTAVVRMWRKWLNRRSQQKKCTWDRFKQILARYKLPKPRIVHSYLRYAANP